MSKKAIHVEDPVKPRRGPKRPWKHLMQTRRRQEAEARQAARAARSDEEQLARLDALLGVGVGAQRERARLATRMENAA